MIAEGTTDQLKSRVGGDLLALRVVDGPTAEAAAVVADPGLGRAPGGGRGRRGLAAGVREGAALLAEVVRRLDAAGLEISDLALRRLTLDDVFLALTGHLAEAAADDGESPESRPPRPRAGEDEEQRMSLAAHRPLPRRRLWWTAADAAVAKRNLYRYIRVPPLLPFSTIQPVMFVLFTYVFGGAIQVPGWTTTSTT